MHVEVSIQKATAGDGRRKPRAPNIDGPIALTITKVIRRMTGEVTWTSVADAVEAETGHRYTRQAFHRNQAIHAAFRSRASGDAPSGQKRPRSAEVGRLLERIAMLEGLVDRHERRAEAMTSKFGRWARNAASRGMTEKDLEDPP